jgi:hypothetical protein
MSAKYNKRREIQELLYFKCKAHTFNLGWPSYPGKVLTWVSPRQYPVSFCRELAKASHLGLLYKCP